MLYLSDRLVDAWGNVEEIIDLGEAGPTFMHDGFREREFYEEGYPRVSETYAFASFTDRMTVGRVITDDEGMYLHLAPETPIADFVEGVKDVVDST